MDYCLSRNSEGFIKTSIYFKCPQKIAHNVQAFVLLGASSIRRPRRRVPDQSTKVEIIFKSQIEFLQLELKLSSERGDDERSSSSPNGTNAFVSTSFSS
jgi:hypothetical protein